MDTVEVTFVLVYRNGNAIKIDEPESHELIRMLKRPDIIVILRMGKDHSVDRFTGTGGGSGWQRTPNVENS